MRVVHASFHCDPDERQPQSLLDAWPTLLGVTSALVRAGVDTTIVQGAACDATLLPEGIKAIFVKHHPGLVARSLGRSTIRAPRHLLEQIQAAKPDVVHVNGLAYPLAIRDVVNAMPSTPVVIQDHGLPPVTAWRRPLWRIATANVAALTFTSREQVKPYMDAGFFRTNLPIHEIVEGSTNFKPGNREAARAKSGMHGDPCILWAGHLDANKDPLMILEAFERAVDRLNDPRLWCCFREAPLLSRVRARISQSPVLKERVILLGSRPSSEVESYFRAADFLVQGSHHESCGYSVIEALACGTPPLVTDIPSFRRIVGDAGSLTPVGDAGALADALVDWSQRDRATTRRNARARFERELSFDAIGTSLRSVYESVLGSR